MNIFSQPKVLWLLALFPLLGLRVVLGARRRRRDWVELGQASRLRSDGAFGWMMAIGLLILALAQPRWGRGVSPPSPPGHDVVFLLDTSRSMGAEDAVPNRLGVATEAAESLIRSLGATAGNRAAVVAFAGRGRLRCPLTENLGAVAETLHSLRPGDVQPGGTNLGAGLEAAADAFGTQAPQGGRTIVLFSDGEDHAGTWNAQVDRLREAGVVVHSIAIGDPKQGHTVPSGSGSGTVPLRYRGTMVLSKREDRAFESLARQTGGAVIPLGLASIDLGSLYHERIAPIAAVQRETIRPSERSERFPIFVGAALLVGLGGTWQRRSRWLRTRRWLVPSLLLAFTLGADRPDDSASARIAAGRADYAAGRFEAALASFEKAIAAAPHRAIPRFDAAAALFQLARYSDARERYQEAAERADTALRTKIDYALGNTALALGDLTAALVHYDDCLASTARGKMLDAVRRDAAINRKFAEDQAKAKSTSSDPRDDSSPGSNRDRSPKPGGEESSPEESGAESQDSSNGQNPPPNRAARAPGPGGSGSPPPGAESPEAQLDAAVKNIQEAKSRRVDDPLPPTDDQRRDW